MNFYEYFLDNLRELVTDFYGERIEGCGLDVDDFIGTLMDTVEDASDNMSQIIIDFVDSELPSED